MKRLARFCLAVRVYGPLDAVFISVYRFFYRRKMYRTGYVFQWFSQCLENFWFRINWKRAGRRAEKIARRLK